MFTQQNQKSVICATGRILEPEGKREREEEGEEGYTQQGLRKKRKQEEV